MHSGPFTRCVLTLFLACLAFAGGSTPVIAWGGHHHGHISYSAHYHSHGSYEGLGYFFLGVAGILVLSHYLDSARYNRGIYERQRYTPPAAGSSRRSVRNVPAYSPAPPLPGYDHNAGWKELTEDNPDRALDIFAVQSLRNLESAIPRIGFALAAASKGEPARAVRAMRKAVETDPDALRDIRLNNEMKSRIAILADDYVTATGGPVMDEPDKAFMLAALSFLERDYDSADRAIGNADNQESTVLLRRMIREELGD